MNRLLAAGYGPGVCADARPDVARGLADELGWHPGEREEAVAQDVVVTVTPGERPVVLAAELVPGQHVAALGADAQGKSEIEREALRRCRLFCDEWRQASGGGELSGAASAGEVSRDDVTELGEVLAARAAGRESEAEVTLFDSTGLAIQDLAITLAVLDAWRAGTVVAPTIPV